MLLKIGKEIYDVGKSFVDDFLKAGAKTVKPTAANRSKAEKVTPKVKQEIKEKIASTMAAVQRRNQPKELQSPTVRRALEKAKAGKSTAVVKPTGTALVKAKPSSVVPKSKPPVPARRTSTAVATRKPSSVVPTRKPSVPARRPARTPLATSSKVRETMSPNIRRALTAAGLAGIGGASYLASKLNDKNAKAETTGKSKATPQGMADRKPTKPKTTAKPTPKTTKRPPASAPKPRAKTGKESFPVFNDGIVVGVVHKGPIGMVYTGRPQFNPIKKGGMGFSKAKEKFDTPSLRKKAAEQISERKNTKNPLSKFSLDFQEKQLNKNTTKKYGGKVVKKKEGSKVAPSKYKGFSKLPEKVQQKMDSGLAKQYMSGGKVARQVKGYGKARKPKK